MSKKLTTISLRLEQDEREEWQSYADNHHEGSLSRMIRAIVTKEIYPSEENNTQIDLGAIEKIVNRTTQKFVSELKSDLFVIKSMIRDGNQSIGQDHSLSDIVKLKAKEYLLIKERKVGFDELYNYLKLECEECVLFFNSSERSMPGGAKIELLEIFDQVMSELYEETGSKLYLTEEF
ncbi:MAG: hypothetical protein IH840_11405 [Candidatus Heimdallarchaeota archaeon]|nr:hypothetical protein [Candidatus Heimdallarchaeota archaeon]